MVNEYVSAQIKVTDAAACPEIVPQVTPIMSGFGIEYLDQGGRVKSHEGAPSGGRIVVIRLPNIGAAQNWYHSKDYAGAMVLRTAEPTTVQTIVEGI